MAETFTETEILFIDIIGFCEQILQQYLQILNVFPFAFPF